MHTIVPGIYYIIVHVVLVYVDTYCTRVQHVSTEYEFTSHRCHNMNIVGTIKRYMHTTGTTVCSTVVQKIKQICPRTEETPNPVRGVRRRGFDLRDCHPDPPPWPEMTIICIKYPKV